MAYTTIDKPNDYFNTITYSGDGSSPVSVTGVGFQPDWVWVKRRNGTTPNVLYDVVRGTGKQLISNDTSIEATNNQYGYISAFESDGFEATAGSTSITRLYGSGGTYVAWNWLAGGTASSNTDGSITSSVSANTTSGFSIVSYTANGTAGATIGHGLGAVPQVVITKDRDATSNWFMYHIGTDASAPEDKYMELESTDAVQDFPVWNDTAPTSSVFSIGTAAGNNTSGNDIIAYCFAEKKGFSKFGSYTGNGNADGPFVYTGFKPAWVMIKRTDSTGNWFMFDNKRAGYNSENYRLQADSTVVEADPGESELLSNGFKMGFTSSNVNASGGTYLYMAFAENPFVTSTGIPATAR